MKKASESSSLPKKTTRNVLLSVLGVSVLIALIVGLTVPVGGTDEEGGGGSVLSNLFNRNQCTDPCVPGTEDIMSPKAHGTSEFPVQSDLLWGCDFDLADRICNFNRHYAEFSGYWETTSFLENVQSNIDNGTTLTFYDSGWKGSPLFTAPVDRTWDEFIQESTKHGWPSFRDSEVNWDIARVLPNGEMVSIDGTHLGHNLPDKKGNRYCINIVSIAGQPVADESERKLNREELR